VGMNWQQMTETCDELIIVEMVFVHVDFAPFPDV
jgi:hypothetical protein